MQLLRDPRAFLLILVWLAAIAAQIRTSVFDAALLGRFHAGSDVALIGVARALSLLGGWTALLPVTLIAAAILWRRKDRRGAWVLLAFTLWGRVIVDAVKLMIGRARPDELPQLADTVSASFPSGHSANATIVYGAVALLLAPGRRWALAFALALSFAIGLTRLLLGVHWPSDVVGGWALGLLWTLALHRFVQTEGTLRPSASLKGGEENEMSDNNRTDAARRTDDSDLIESMEDAPSFSGAHGGDLQRDIASRAEQQHDVDGKPGVTRVQDKDKPEQANLPRFNESN